ncbi:hypothetical protein SOASR032_07880 [Pragia fontium]|uniref:Uncharacterized protein n=1 Tax=Pragia fontium TaxID=82985 RepID=A0ABQ5LFQ9_9GAMM|nr:hypothetical protein SOASR032_07880 [Pragia fontium]
MDLDYYKVLIYEISDAHRKFFHWQQAAVEDTQFYFVLRYLVEVWTNYLELSKLKEYSKIK